MKQADMMTVIVDTREQRPWTFGGAFRIERAALPAGDYSIGGFEMSVAIERKTLDDYVQSLILQRERFKRECERLRSYELKAIVVEADAGDVFAHTYRSKAAPNAVIATGLALLHDYGVATIWAGNREHAERMAETMLRRFYRKQNEAK
ncbi:ERCC4 domain-containing protein [Sorangium sp. So ce1099]|uniref:ERCC4 domain-containing protein n=1 Tax=Sorangium sp. So ce1099 TaxID=3133331 RepID=UPI003F618492